LAVYFENGFRRAKEQVLLFNPEAKVDELDPFKVVVEGKLVDDKRLFFLLKLLFGL
jgi:hypothetical protein